MSKPLSAHSDAIVVSARDSLVKTGQHCAMLRADWMTHPLYQQAVSKYDIIMDYLPEWAEARRLAKRTT